MANYGLTMKTDEKRRAINDMIERKIITLPDRIQGENGRWEFLDKRIYKWSDEEVEKYYENNITDDEAKEYQAQLDKEANERYAREEDQKEKDRLYRENRPELIKAGYILLVNNLANQKVPQSEQEVIKNKFGEEIEYKALKYDKEYGRLAEDDKERFEELDLKYAVTNYDRLTKENVENKKKLDEVQKKLDAYKAVPKKPGAFTKFINKIYRWRTKDDLASVKNYNEYKAILDEKLDINEKISKTSAKIDKIKGEHHLINFDEKVSNRADKVRELAKKMVVKTCESVAEHAGLEPVQLSEEQINIQADIMMKSKQFKATVEMYNADADDVDLNDFYNSLVRKTENRSSIATTITTENVFKIGALPAATEPTA